MGGGSARRGKGAGEGHAGLPQREGCPAAVPTPRKDAAPGNTKAGATADENTLRGKAQAPSTS